MPTYARREGGAYARGGTGLACRYAGLFGGGLWRQGDDAAALLEIVAYRDLQAHRAIDHAGPEFARERGLTRGPRDQWHGVPGDPGTPRFREAQQRRRPGATTRPRRGPRSGTLDQFPPLHTHLPPFVRM